MQSMRNGQAAPNENLPSNIEAEQQVLGALLINNETFHKVSGQISEDSFYDPVHADLYRRIARRIDAGQIASPVTLKNELETHSGLRDLGGPSYLVRIAGASIASYAISDFVGMLNDLRGKRDVLAAIEAARLEVEDGAEGSAAIALRLEEQVGRIAGVTSTKPLIRSHLSSLCDAIQQVSDAYSGVVLPGLSTGLPALDKKIGFLRPGNLIVLAGRPAMGKAQPLSSRIKTPDGWKEMGQIQVGDKLASVDGHPSVVTGVFPQGVRKTFRVHFSDGRSTRCCGDHLWRIESSRFKGAKVVSTKDLKDMISRPRYHSRVRVPLVSGNFGRPDVLPIDPWLLGVLLGDGGLSGDVPILSTPDAEILWNVLEAIGPEQRISKAGGYDYRICGTEHGRNALTDTLRDLGLMGCRSEGKFIPGKFLNADRNHRLQLLQGMMDTDGWAESFGAVRYSTSSAQLAIDFQSLVRSLGGLCSVSEKIPYAVSDGVRKEGLRHYVCNVRHECADELFTLIRKKRRANRVKPVGLTVKSIEPDDCSEVQCISVSHPSQLYITDDYIVTHNTTVAQNFAKHATTHESTGCFFGSLEMLAEEMSKRFLSKGLAERGINIPYSKLIYGNLTEEEMRHVVDEAKRQEALPLFVGERDVRDISRFRAAAKRAQQRMADTAMPLGLIVVDYLQMMAAKDAKGFYERVSMASDACKSLAMELEVPVVALAQLSRDVERREPPVPMLSDLRESGKLEEDADVVLFCYRHAYYLRRELDKCDRNDTEKMADLTAEFEAKKNDLDLIVEKQRSGATGTVRSYIDPACCHVSADKSNYEGNIL